MVCKPGYRKPASPVDTSDKQQSANNCQHPDKKYPDTFILYRTLFKVFTSVIYQANATGNDENKTDDDDRYRTTFHGLGRSKRNLVICFAYQS